MKPDNLLRWYPRRWREQFGEELLALIQDTLDEGRPTWRLRFSVAWGGLHERAHQAGRAAQAAGKRVPSRWLMAGTAGWVIATVPWNLKASFPPARAWQGTAAVDALTGVIAFTGAVMLASGLVAVPAFVAFVRAGGWPKIRRRVAWATGATVAAGGGLAGLFLGQHSMSLAQVSHSWAFFTGVTCTAVALVIALGLWASAAAFTAKHLKLTSGARAAQLVLTALTLTAVYAIVPVNAIWLAAIQSSLGWLAIGLVTLAFVGVDAGRRIPQAVRRGRRLRAAASGATIVNPSAQRTNGGHRA